VRRDEFLSGRAASTTKLLPLKAVTVKALQAKQVYFKEFYVNSQRLPVRRNTAVSILHLPTTYLTTFTTTTASSQARIN
jgi:hypothetical protein